MFLPYDLMALASSIYSACCCLSIGEISVPASIKLGGVLAWLSCIAFSRDPSRLCSNLLTRCSKSRSSTVPVVINRLDISSMTALLITLLYRWVANCWTGHLQSGQQGTALAKWVDTSLSPVYSPYPSIS